MTDTMQTVAAADAPRVLGLDEIDAVSGGKKAVAVIVEKCTVRKDREGNEVMTCKVISSQGL
ncbi:MAG: hypothetical protein M5U32_21975 [Myxococcota bacterium]|nr:hypothetical protein [Myxococcota bacterium]PWB61720.1 MAG: hypothetical protein C3F17_12310 [Bradyrhizobiaceae bacterium]